MRTAAQQQNDEVSTVRAAPAADFASPELEQKLLQMNLAELNVPKVHNLNIDALKPSWIERLFGKR